MIFPPFFRKLLKQKEMMNFYKQFIKAGDLCFDIGANTGERTDIFLKLRASAVAVEPQRKCVEILQKKYADKKNVKIIHAAAGSTEGEAKLRICDETDECSTLSADFVAAYEKISGFHWRSSENVKVITLDSLCRKHGVPAFCKIDVEGYESQVLKGLSIPIRTICFEFNRPLLSDTAKCLEILSMLGNYRCNFIEYEKMQLQLPEWIPVNDFRTRLEEYITPWLLTGEIVASLDS